jgi:hypothetical protein
VEETLERIKVQPGVEGYVICDMQGQVLRRFPTMSQETAEMYAASMMHLAHKVSGYAHTPAIARLRVPRHCVLTVLRGSAELATVAVSGGATSAEPRRAATCVTSAAAPRSRAGVAPDAHLRYMHAPDCVLVVTLMWLAAAAAQARGVVRDINPKSELKYLRIRAKRHEVSGARV